MSFVQGYGNRVRGYPLINLDHVAWLVNDHEKRISDVPDHPVTVVPETSGAILVAFHLQEDGSLFVERVPVLAWMIELGTATPITHETLPETWCLEFTTGVWTFPEDCSLDSLAKAEAYAKERELQRHQNLKHRRERENE